MTACSKCVIVTDAAKRMSDIINSILVYAGPEIRNKWLAIRLIDGGYDGVIYDTRQDAISHQIDERFCAYFSFRNAMGGANPRDCQIYLDLHRHAYDSGMRLSEPQAPQVIVPTVYHDFRTGRSRGRYDS